MNWSSGAASPGFSEDMYFALRPTGTVQPERPLGPPGRELEYFLGDGADWQQLNYGQGEGQATLLGCEWGFYYSGDGSFAVHLHEGTVALSVAIEVAERVGRRLFGPEAFRIELVGDWRE